MFQVQYTVGNIVDGALVMSEYIEWVESKQLDLTAKKVKGIAVDKLQVLQMDVSARKTVVGTVQNRPSVKWAAEEEIFKNSFRGSKWYDCTIRPRIEKLFTKLRDDCDMRRIGGYVTNTPRDLLYAFYIEYNKEFNREPRTLAVLKRFRTKVNMYGVFTLRHRG